MIVILLLSLCIPYYIASLIAMISAVKTERRMGIVRVTLVSSLVNAKAVPLLVFDPSVNIFRSCLCWLRCSKNRFLRASGFIEFFLMLYSSVHVFMYLKICHGGLVRLGFFIISSVGML